MSSSYWRTGLVARYTTYSSTRSRSDTSDARTVRVGVIRSKFPDYITSNIFQQHFADFKDDIEKALIIRDLETKESKGYGLVIFTSHVAAENAVSALKGTKLRGKFPLSFRYTEIPQSMNRHFSRVLYITSTYHCLSLHDIQQRTIGFNEFGNDILDVEFVSDWPGLSYESVCVIKFTSNEVAEKARGKLMHLFQGTFYSINVSFDKPSANDASGGFSEAESDSEDFETDDCTLYVGVWRSKFPNSVTNRHLETHFSDFSEHINSAWIVRDHTTRETKGYGFVSFTSAAEAERAMRELRSTKLLGKFSLYISYQKSAHHKSGSHVSADFKKARKPRKPETQLPHSKTYQLRPEAVSLKGLQAAFREIESRNSTKIVKKAGQTVVIHGYSLEDVEQSWKEVRDFVECNLKITRIMKVRYGCAKFLQQKRATDLQELRKQCEILIPPVCQLSEGSIQITVKGTKAATEEVLSKLRKLSSKCHIDTFEMQCPKPCARFWKNRWNHFSTGTAKRPSILIDFSTTQTAATETGKNTVTVLIVGTNQAAFKTLKEKVLKEENCSLMTQKKIRFPKDDFEAVSCNLEQLELTLEQNHSTVISLQKQTNIVLLQAPSSREANIDSALREIMKVISNFSQTRTFFKEHCFEDLVVGMLLTTKPQYCEEIKREASQRSVILHIQKKPKPGLHLQGNRTKVEAAEQKIFSLTEQAKQSIGQTQMVVDTSMYHILSTSAFDKYQEELLEKFFIQVTYPPHLVSQPSLQLQWLWRDDRKQFILYPSDTSAKLTKAKQSNPNGTCFFTAPNGNYYTVDFSTMKQTNFATGFTRDVQCTTSSSLAGELHLESNQSAQSSPNAQWYYMDDQNALTQYTTEDSNLIEKMYKEGVTNSLVIKKRHYIFDFKRMKQINSSTLRSRSILRNEVTVSALDRMKTEKTQKLVITLRGPREHLPVAKRDTERKLKELRYSTTVSLPHTLPSELEQKLHTIIGKHTVDYRIKEDSTTQGPKPCKVFEIEGPEHAVHKAVTEVQAEIINFHSETPSAAGPTIEYPQEWQPQAKTTEVFELPRFSEERRRIASKLRETLPDVNIISVQRIQNKWLWERYEQSKRRTSEKNAGIVNEKELFHGSRKTSAEKIYNSEEGFDMRFSSPGMWGQANYFAVDAKYSNTYAYEKPDGNKELLLAKVLTGDSITCPPDKTLRMPPEKPTLSYSDSNIELEQVRYDTVKGVTRNTQVFMTYSNDKAYPAYLIVYSNTCAPSPTSTQPAAAAAVIKPALLPPQYSKTGLSTSRVSHLDAILRRLSTNRECSSLI